MKKQKLMYIGLVVTLVLGLGAVAVGLLDQSKSANEFSEPTFSQNQVNAHSSAEDCWTIIANKVYDITSYINRHPGGDEIVRACGTDSTDMFKTRTTKEGKPVGSGQPHSDNAVEQLRSFYIGELR